MNSPENPADTQAASLAAALIERIGPLAQAAADAKQGVDADRERVAGSGEADALIDTVVERVDELEADCRRLMRILVGFEAAASQSLTAPTTEPAVDPPEPVADGAVAEAEPPVAAELTPAEEAAGVTTFPGATTPPTADPIAAAPPTGAPIAAAPPIGEPITGEPPSDQPETAEPPVPAPAEADPAPVDEPVAVAVSEPEIGSKPTDDQPVHVSEGVRLLATQMSVAGASSDDIARRLHDDFGVEDADRLIAHLFGGRT